MANKFVAAFLVFVVIVATVQLPKVAAEDKFDATYKSCFSSCENECKADGKGASFCEVKCDNNCADKETAEKLNINVN